MKEVAFKFKIDPSLPQFTPLLSSEIRSLTGDIIRKNTSLIDFKALNPVVNDIKMSAVKSGTLAPLFRQYRSTLQQISEQISELLPKPSKEIFQGLNRILLPPNLRPLYEEITIQQVINFVEAEGIPLYIVPSASIALRFLNADTHAKRRKLLNTCSHQIVEDCENVLSSCVSDSTASHVFLVRDGIAAWKQGNYASAQAVFTVSLDALIFELIPDTNLQREIKSHKGTAPKSLKQGKITTYCVWLPIYNAHSVFYKHQEDVVPREYSRHATVHGGVKWQFSKRNCIQSLMLATSLIGYKEQQYAVQAKRT